MARSKSVARARAAFFSKDLTVDLDSARQMQIKCRPMFERELRKLLREIKAEAREIVRVDHEHTGRLRRSIQVGPVTRVHAHRISGTVTAGSRLAPYARHVHEGTSAHIIHARPGGAMAFAGLAVPGLIQGRDVFAKKVNHPGTRPNRFLNIAARRVVAGHYGGTVVNRR